MGLTCSDITGFTPGDVKIITNKLNAIEPIIESGCAVFDFDYPDYGGIPKRIYMEFDGGQVDAIQDLFQYRSSPYGTPFTTVEVARALARGLV